MRHFWPRRGERMGYEEMRRQVLEDKATSFWLTDALAALERRDPVNAAKDAELLAAMMGQRAYDALTAVQPDLRPIRRDEQDQRINGPSQSP